MIQELSYRKRIQSIDILTMEAVATCNITIQKSTPKDTIKQLEVLFSKVELPPKYKVTKESLKSLYDHSFDGDIDFAALSVITEILDNGIVLSHWGKAHKIKDETSVVAAPIEINNERYYAVLICGKKKDGFRYPYAIRVFSDVFIKDELLKIYRTSTQGNNTSHQNADFQKFAANLLINYILTNSDLSFLTDIAQNISVDKDGNNVSVNGWGADFVSESRMCNIILETIIDYVINDAKHSAPRTNLLESTNTKKYRERTLEVIRQFFGDAPWLYEAFDNPAENPNGLSRLEYIEHCFKDEYFHGRVHPTVMRLESIMMKVALGLGFKQQQQDRAKLNRLCNIVHFISAEVNRAAATKSKHNLGIEKMDESNTTFETLNQQFGTVIDKMQADEDDRLANGYWNNEVNPNYEVLSNIDFETAQKYGRYSHGLCYTLNRNTWNHYTNDGINNVYLILRKDWKTVPEEHSENSPYDDYGLSMIFLFVDGDGKIAYSNTRWNHDVETNDRTIVDHSFSKEDISELLGVNFNNFFKPNDKWNKLSNDAFVGLNGGKAPTEVFDWCCESDEEGFMLVELGGKRNFIDANGKLLSPNQWFDDSDDFRNGLAEVELDGKWYYIDTDGNFYDYHTQKPINPPMTNEGLSKYDGIISESIRYTILQLFINKE